MNLPKNCGFHSFHLGHGFDKQIFQWDLISNKNKTISIFELDFFLKKLMAKMKVYEVELINGKNNYKKKRKIN